MQLHFLLILFLPLENWYENVFPRIMTLSHTMQLNFSYCLSLLDVQLHVFNLCQ